MMLGQRTLSHASDTRGHSLFVSRIEDGADFLQDFVDHIAHIDVVTGHWVLHRTATLLIREPHGNWEYRSVYFGPIISLG